MLSSPQNDVVSCGFLPLPHTTTNSLSARIFSFVFALAAVVIMTGAFAYANQMRKSQCTPMSEIDEQLSITLNGYAYVILNEDSTVLSMNEAAATLLQESDPNRVHAVSQSFDLRKLPCLPFSVHVHSEGRHLQGVAFPLGVCFPSQRIVLLENPRCNPSCDPPCNPHCNPPSNPSCNPPCNPSCDPPCVPSFDPQQAPKTQQES